MKITIDLSVEEHEALTEMSRFAEMSNEATIRQALRLYHIYREKGKAGHSIAWLDESGKLVQSEFGCGE